MNAFIGAYECKIDTKGRVLIPTALKRQMSSLSEGFVLKRSVFESCLELWRMSDWNVMMEKINKLNKFNRKNEMFVRKFMAGVKLVEVDESGRILVAKDLIEFAKIEKDVVLASKGNVIEIWDKNLYENMLNNDEFDFGDLAEEVMGGIEDE